MMIRVRGFYPLGILKSNKTGVLDFFYCSNTKLGRLLSSIDDLQDFDRDDFPSNDFVGLFNSLSTCVETGTSEETIFNGERPEGTALLPVAIQAKPDVDEGGGLTNGW